MLALLLEHGSNIHRRDMHPMGGWTPFLGSCQQVQRLLCRCTAGNNIVSSWHAGEGSDISQALTGLSGTWWP